MQTLADQSVQFPQIPQQTKRISRKKIRKQRQSSWTVNQQASYVQFLKKNSCFMKTTQTRKKHKVFKLMSQIIGTRSAIQVKSHHQKLQQRYHSTYNIILNVGNLIKQRLSYQYRQKKVDFSESLTDFARIQEKDYPIEDKQVLPQNFENFIFQDCSENYDQISVCMAFNQNQPLI